MIPLSIRRNPWIWPTIVLAALCIAGVFAPWIAPHNPYDLVALRLEDSGLAPPWSAAARAESGPDNPIDTRFFLGTDRQGRDLLSAVIYGLRVSLLVGVSGTLIALSVGVTLGLLAGYFRGPFDAVIMRLADIQLSFPSVLIALFMMAIWGQGLGKIIVAIGVVHWVIYARLVRGVVLSEREKDYIAAIQVLGARAPRILGRHLLPNIMGPVMVVSAVQFASIVMLEATLSYLGLGVPITRPSLGMLIRLGYDDFFSGQWWIWFFPGLALVILIVAVNWLSDILRSQQTLES